MKFRITQRPLSILTILLRIEFYITSSFTLQRALHYLVFYITTSFTLLRALHYLTLLSVLHYYELHITESSTLPRVPHYLSLHYLVLRSGYIAALNSTVLIQIYTPVL